MCARSARAGWLVVLLMAAAPAFSQVADDTAVKARVALAIVRFAEMPRDRPPGPMQLCVAASGPAPQSILGLAWYKVGTRSVHVQVGPPFAGCDVIYIHSTYVPWRELLAESRAPALTVGDTPGFLAAGGMVELVIDSDAVRFDVNLRALRAQSIRLPAKVLSLARQVQE
jgi:YfiR/HmsC-like